MAKQTKNFIKTFFYGSDEEGQTQPMEKEVVITNEHAALSSVAQNLTMTTSVPINKQEAGVSGIVNNDMIATIWDAIKSNRKEGPDYNSLKEIAQTLIGIVPDETMRLQGAFNVLKGKYTDLTKQSIISSIDECISVVEGQKKMGLEQCESKRLIDVDGKRTQIDSINVQANEILQEIEEKKASYEELVKQTRELETEALNADNEINQQKLIFMNSIQSVLNQLNSDKTKVSNLSV